VEQALINVVIAGIYYKKPKEAEDPEEYILKLAMTIFPNEEKYHKIKNDYKEFYGQDPKIFTSIIKPYKLYYNLAKDHFIKEAQIDKEAEDFLNL
ncbi:20151_t:CDS:2, partial [Cetraspora pellucida]